MKKINIEETQTPDEYEDYWNKFRSFHQFYFRIRNNGLEGFDSNGDFICEDEDGKKFDSAFLLQAGLDYFLEREEYLKCADLNRFLIEVKKRRAANSIADSSETTVTSTI